MNKVCTKKLFYYRIVCLLIYMTAIIMLTGACSKANKSGNNNKVPQGLQVTKQADQGKGIAAGEQNNTSEPKSGASLSRDNSKAVLTSLNTGSFTVGKDIPAGRYVITADGSGNLFINSASGMPYVNELLGIESFGVKNITTDISDGDTIQISGINKAIFTPADTVLYKDALTTGRWVVGLDFPAGRYEASSSGGNGNFTVTDKSGLLKVNEILGGGDYGVDKVTTDLTDGDIITINGINEVKFTAK